MYLIEQLVLPIIVIIVAVIGRLMKRDKPLRSKYYIIVFVVYLFLFGVNDFVPTEDKIAVLSLTALILVCSYFLEKKIMEAEIT
ncbi:hypothetical protein [Acinetobacter kanungonis]|uniref:hypothetical protein n=1 Tax=Acinetobacter kanungonis TaxID=2699469 RepID=UPI00137B5C5D|nr:hypothetical protein [Acinetobacter kanungonis]NCI79744.1 hypothetical protein [Acinetobacter kanungonis]